MVAGQAEVGGEGRQGGRGEEFAGEAVAYEAGDAVGAGDRVVGRAGPWSGGGRAP
ncbi:hypothetical protein RKD31_002575 [Streptomyces sp. SAI-163]